MDSPSQESSAAVKGAIGYFGLVDWWMCELTEEERRHIVTTFQPLGSSGDALTSRNTTYRSDTAVGLLQNLSGWFSAKQDRPLAHKILSKAEQLASQHGGTLDVHFLYGRKVDLFYMDRDKPEFLEKAIRACWEQINMAEDAAKAFLKKYEGDSLPSHRGYKQLAIILEKEGKYKEVVALCERAAAQGWRGDWENRMARCKKKLNK